MFKGIHRARGPVRVSGTEAESAGMSTGTHRAWGAGPIGARPKRGFVACALAVAVLSGCQGPETRVLPRQNMIPKYPYEPVGADGVPEQASPFYLHEALSFLAASERVLGTPAETNAAEYIKRLLIEYGYDVAIQRFPVEAEVAASNLAGRQSGTNVVAVTGEAPGSDIVLVTAGHDTVPGSPGANDNASGVVVFLETARLAANYPSDTELRFVSLSGMDAGQQGLRFYLESLPEEERRRIIGAIHLDTLGYKHGYDVVLGTIDGGPTLLGDMLKEHAREGLGQQWDYRMDGLDGPTSFGQFRIPAVRLTQSVTAFEQGTWQDRPDIVDEEKMAEASRVLFQTIKEIMQTDTGSYLAASQEGHYYRDGAWLQRVGQGIPFGAAREMVGGHYGWAGSPLAAGPEGSGGDFPGGSFTWPEEYVAGGLSEPVKGGEWYQYPMKWLAVDQVILSDFYYREGLLAGVALEAESAGITAAEMRQRLVAQYGQPQESVEAAAAGATVFRWDDYAGRLVYRLWEQPGGYTVTVAAGQAGEIRFARFPVAEAAAQGQAWDAGAEPLSAKEKAALDLAGQILRPEDLAMIHEIVLYTDGIGGSQVYWTGPGAGRFGQSAEVGGQNAEVGGQSAGGTGQGTEVGGQNVGGSGYGTEVSGLISEASAQGADGANGLTLHIDVEDMADSEGNYRNYAESCKQLVKACAYFYYDGYGRLFHQSFEQTMGDEFAVAFQLFVLTDKPEGERTQDEAKLLFFYQYGPLMAIRGEIREQLGLP